MGVSAAGPASSRKPDRLLAITPRQPQPQAAEPPEADFGKFLAVLQRRRKLALVTLLGTMLIGGLVTTYQRAFRPVFLGSFKLLISDPISQDRGDGSGTQLENLAIPDQASTNLDTLIQVLTSPLLLNPVERQLGMPAGSIRSAVSIEMAKGAGGSKGGEGVLDVSLAWPEPTQGQKILERISQEYLNYSLSERQEKLTQGLEFLDKQAPQLQRRVNELQNRLSSFRQANSFVEPTQPATSIQNRRLLLQERLLDLQKQEARLEALSASVRAGKLNNTEFQTGTNPGQTTESGLMGAGSFSSLISALSDLEKKLAEARASYTESAPQVRELRQQVDQLRPLLQRRQLDAIESSLGVIEGERREIQRQLGQLSRSFAASPQKIKHYESLEQQLQVSRDNLTSYIKARETFRLQVAQRTLPWRVISPPGFGGRPVKPDVGRNLLLSLMLGTLAGVGLALLRDKLDDVFHHPEQLKDALPVPILGVIPYLPNLKKATVAKAVDEMEGGMRFQMRESLRNLFANFRLLRGDKTLRLVAITSASQGEGKTTATTLFAQTLAQLGQRVLLVDADLRRPMVHLAVGSQNERGLANLLTDSSLQLQELIQPLQPGLDLLPAGPIPPDASRLFSSSRCGEVVRQIRELAGYDVVLFDTAPALLLSDPVLLSEHLDGLMFVVGMQRVPRQLPIQAVQRVLQTGADVLGVLANLTEAPRMGSYPDPLNYGYGYGDGDGYGYGYGDDQSESMPGGKDDVLKSQSQPRAQSNDHSSKTWGSRIQTLRKASRKALKWLDDRR